MGQGGRGGLWGQRVLVGEGGLGMLNGDGGNICEGTNDWTGEEILMCIWTGEEILMCIWTGEEILMCIWTGEEILMCIHM